MPPWLDSFANNQPAADAVDTLRAAALGQPMGSDGWCPLAWAGGILLIFFPISVWLYQSRTGV